MIIRGSTRLVFENMYVGSLPIGLSFVNVQRMPNMPLVCSGNG